MVIYSLLVKENDSKMTLGDCLIVLSTFRHIYLLEKFIRICVSRIK